MANSKEVVTTKSITISVSEAVKVSMTPSRQGIQIICFAKMNLKSSEPMSVFLLYNEHWSIFSVKLKLLLVHP